VTDLTLDHYRHVSGNELKEKLSEEFQEMWGHGSSAQTPGRDNGDPFPGLDPGDKRRGRSLLMRFFLGLLSLSGKASPDVHPS